MQLRPQTVALAFGILLLTLAFAEGMSRRELARDYERQRMLVTAHAELVRAKLEARLENTLFVTRTLVAHAAADPRMNRAQFERLSTEVLREAKLVRNISLAPNNVVAFIYPREGYEGAIGLRYMEIPEQRDVVQHITQTGQSLLTGPTPLAQGGLAFISRTPVYIPDNGGMRYWGVSNVVIDAQALFEAAGLMLPTGTRIALRAKEQSGTAGAVFFGESATFTNEPVLLPVELPGGEWQLAASPVEGWGKPSITSYRLIGYTLALIFSSLVAVLLVERERSEELALHDPLTKLPNRLFFDLRLEHEVERAQRYHQSFALLYVDLDDFKPVNDLHGHKAGDRVLVETGRRLRESLRRMDTVARIGGDEFMVILSDVSGEDEAVKVADKLIENLRKPIPMADTQVTVGASIGISFYPSNGKTTDLLIRQADHAMYHAKGQGKNRCVCATPTA